MPKFSRDKGMRFERLLVSLLKGKGIPAVRVPLSGASEFQKGDVIMDGEKVVEAKHRESGFTNIYKYIEGPDDLMVKQNNDDPLVILRFNDFVEMYLRAGKKCL